MKKGKRKEKKRKERKKNINTQFKISLIPSFFNGRRSNIFDPFSQDIWDPFKDFPFPSSSSLYETLEAHVFKVDLPRLKKEEVKVERREEDKNDTWHCVERSSGKCLRSFRLPENAKMDEIKALMENGVLTVTVPKVEAKKPEVKAIEISS
ncbi:hypothetical protein RGQ29_000783 [Quercus rubra]|uniref:SHSP domain-containing protein n=1 Tax=Quercus rubra TaxID=3512 RepID=A0AAN7GGV9_QUERU|nr:hypothetical protein RGQ29_000783 [Quercus rubra]